MPGPDEVAVSVRWRGRVHHPNAGGEPGRTPPIGEAVRSRLTAGGKGENAKVGPLIRPVPGLDLAGALFAADCAFHDPQIPGVVGPQAIADTIKMYQTGVEGHWTIEDIFASGDDRDTVRWTGSGVHTGDVMGIPPRGKAVRLTRSASFAAC